MGGLRLKEQVCPTAANINLTKPQLLNKEGGQVACCAATKITAKSTPYHNKTVNYKQHLPPPITFPLLTVMIHPHFSLPQLSPLCQQYQHQYHQHLLSMSTIHQQCPPFQLPVTPPPFTPETIYHNPWRTNKQSCSTQRQNQAMGLFFHSWTPEMQPCSNPLCCILS